MTNSLTKQEREKQLAKALHHLENERRLAETIVSVQAQLEEYRKTNAAGQARLRLHRYSIRINDPDNGVWLPKSTSDTPQLSANETMQR